MWYSLFDRLDGKLSKGLFNWRIHFGKETRVSGWKLIVCRGTDSWQFVYTRSTRNACDFLRTVKICLTRSASPRLLKSRTEKVPTISYTNKCLRNHRDSESKRTLLSVCPKGSTVCLLVLTGLPVGIMDAETYNHTFSLRLLWGFKDDSSKTSESYSGSLTQDTSVRSIFGQIIMS